MEKETPPTPIAQKHLFGCSVACVAFILRLNYSTTLKLFNKSEYKAEYYGSYCKEITEILNNQGKNFEYKYVKENIKRKIYQNNTIVFIKRSKKYPDGHYLCRYKNLWMDPWINFQNDKKIKKAKAGFRKRLPGKPIYVILPK